MSASKRLILMIALLLAVWWFVWGAPAIRGQEMHTTDMWGHASVPKVHDVAKTVPLGTIKHTVKWPADPSLGLYIITVNGGTPTFVDSDPIVKCDCFEAKILLKKGTNYIDVQGVDLLHGNKSTVLSLKVEK